VDTSALIDGLERYYPEHNFPALWAEVDKLIHARRFVISEEVLDEAQRKTLAAKDWCEARKGTIVVATDAAIALEVRRILQLHPNLVKGMKGRNRADPFVVAVASLSGATVVTGEGSDGTADRPKIPYVCAQLGVPSIRLTDLIRLEGWIF
jgi:hypothetical protein